MTNRIDVNRLLLEMRSIKSQAQAFNPTNDVRLDQGGLRGVAPREVNGPSFGSVMANAVEKVNSIQQESGRLAKAYVKGDPSVDIADVMIASQKSSVAFTAATEVRNKVVEAYKDIMNMPL